MIKRARIKAGLTQDELARRLGFEGQYISNIERNLAEMPVKYYKKLSKILDIPINKLIEHRLEFERERLMAVLK